ncbi:MAG: asparagine--tRNA ligase [Gammaproteobacteria bacterium]|nr:asparagine--tRNA ligase [Gammaproteobacteria bacterium]
MTIKKYSIAECLQFAEAPAVHIAVQGWVKTRRDSKAGFSFVQLHDGSCFPSLQLVINQDLANYANDVLKLTAGCSLEACGILVPSQGKGQRYELQVSELNIIGWVDKPESYPIQAKKHSLEFLREVAHLRPRTNTFSAVTRVRNEVSFAIHQFFQERGFYWIHTPLITASDCEGAGEMFRVTTLDPKNPPLNDDGKVNFKEDFFKQQSFLTVSGQLNVEAYCMAMSKVYTFGPTFRAENSNTSRHLAEFWMVEPEIAFANLDDVASLAKDMLQYVCQHILARCPDDMQFFQEHVDNSCIERIQHMANSEFVSIDYQEAIDILKKAKQDFQYPVEFGLDLQSEHERYITEQHFKKPVIVKNYPAAIKSFYMRLNDDGTTVAAMDILAPGIGEIIGGSQREDRIDLLEQRMQAAGLNLEPYQWYLDLRRYGSVPHAGFGLGLERLLSYITGLGNVRDVIPFPRTPGNITF